MNIKLDILVMRVRIWIPESRGCNFGNIQKCAEIGVSFSLKVNPSKGFTVILRVKLVKLDETEKRKRDQICQFVNNGWYPFGAILTKLVSSFLELN